ERRGRRLSELFPQRCDRRGDRLPAGGAVPAGLHLRPPPRPAGRPPPRPRRIAGRRPGMIRSAPPTFAQRRHRSVTARPVFPVPSLPSRLARGNLNGLLPHAALVTGGAPSPAQSRPAGQPPSATAPMPATAFRHRPARRRRLARSAASIGPRPQAVPAARRIRPAPLTARNEAADRIVAACLTDRPATAHNPLAHRPTHALPKGDRA